MHAGVAYCEDSDSFTAGYEAVRQALDRCPASRCDLVVIFSTALHDSEHIHAGVRRAAGPRPRIIGGDAVGALTNHELGYGGYQVGAAVLAFDGDGAGILAEGDLADQEERVGRVLGRQLADGRHERPSLLLYDSVNRRAGRMKLNMATPLLAGMHAEAGVLPQLVGAGLCGDMTGSPTRQIIDDTVRDQTAIALTFPDDVRMHTTILHGCEPASDYRTVTRVDGATVLELDHRPAVEVTQELLGASLPLDKYGFFVTLGINTGDPWAPFDESAYVNRLCLKVDRERGGLVMFEPDIEAGSRVQFMHRNVTMHSIAPRVEDVFRQAAGRRPVFALYIDCGGRAAAYAGMEEEEAAMVQRAVADRVPLLGFYSGVEIGQVQNRPRPLDWTGVFCLFSVAS